MEQSQIIEEWEAKAKALKLSIAAVCREAGVHVTTFSRWKHDPDRFSMSFSSMNKMNRAFESLSKAEAA